VHLQLDLDDAFEGVKACISTFLGANAGAKQEVKSKEGKPQVNAHLIGGWVVRYGEGTIPAPPSLARGSKVYLPVADW
jgi:hypothetical protein